MMMIRENKNKNIMIIAGEVSGDLHGAALIEELKKIDNELSFFGIGGDKMKAAGMTLNYHLDKMAFLGFVEVIKHLPFIKKVQKNLLKFIAENEIRNIILIDYPGFNLNFARKLSIINDKQKKGIKRHINIVYYISPQIWAWGSGKIGRAHV